MSYEVARVFDRPVAGEIHRSRRLQLRHHVRPALLYGDAEWRPPSSVPRVDVPVPGCQGVQDEPDNLYVAVLGSRMQRRPALAVTRVFLVGAIAEDAVSLQVVEVVKIGEGVTTAVQVVESVPRGDRSVPQSVGEWLRRLA